MILMIIRSLLVFDRIETTENIINNQIPSNEAIRILDAAYTNILSIDILSVVICFSLMIYLSARQRKSNKKLSLLATLMP